MKTYRIIIYHWKTKLVDNEYQFNNEDEARNYALGMFNGLDIAGKEPTGSKIEETINGET